jgi:hypothetical protein
MHQWYHRIQEVYRCRHHISGGSQSRAFCIFDGFVASESREVVAGKIENLTDHYPASKLSISITSSRSTEAKADTALMMQLGCDGGWQDFLFWRGGIENLEKEMEG